MNVPMIVMLEGMEVVLFKPYWLAYTHQVFHVLGDHGFYSPITFEGV